MACRWRRSGGGRRPGCFYPADSSRDELRDVLVEVEAELVVEFSFRPALRRKSDRRRVVEVVNAIPLGGLQNLRNGGGQFFPFGLFCFELLAAVFVNS